MHDRLAKLEEQIELADPADRALLVGQQRALTARLEPLKAQAMNSTALPPRGHGAAP